MNISLRKYLRLPELFRQEIYKVSTLATYILIQLYSITSNVSICIYYFPKLHLRWGQKKINSPLDFTPTNCYWCSRNLSKACQCFLSCTVVVVVIILLLVLIVFWLQSSTRNCNLPHAQMAILLPLHNTQSVAFTCTNSYYTRTVANIYKHLCMYMYIPTSLMHHYFQRQRYSVKNDY